MSEEKKKLKKELKKNECCEGKQKLSIEELDKVNGGGNEPDPLARYSSPCRTAIVE